METNIIISGVGGQGVITMGLLISQAALSEGHNVVMSEIHGLAQRGGSVSVDVRIGNFNAPIVPDGAADLIIGMETMEARRILSRAGKHTKVIVSTERLTPISLSIRHMEYPDFDGIISEISESFPVRTIDSVAIARQAGSYRAANVAIMGFAMGIGWLDLGTESVREQLKRVFSGKKLQWNSDAFSAGLEEAERSQEINVQRNRVRGSSFP